MDGLGHFIAVLLFPMALGVDFLVDPGSYSAHRVYVRSAVSSESLTQMGPDEGRSLIHHHMQKRSADSCNGLEGYEKKLNDNTHEVSALGSVDARKHHSSPSKPNVRVLHCSS